MRHSLSNLLCATAPTADRPLALYDRLASLSAGNLPVTPQHISSGDFCPFPISSSALAINHQSVVRNNSKKSSFPATRKDLLSNVVLFEQLNNKFTNSTNFNRRSSNNSSSGSASSRSETEECSPGHESICDDQLLGSTSRDTNSHSLADEGFVLDSIFNYCHPRNTIFVKLRRSVRGFGIALTGGWRNDSLPCHNSNVSFAQLIRVRRLYPAQPAAESGLIDEDDIILEANGTCFVGLTSIEAFNILHSIPDELHLKILKFKYCPTELQCSIRSSETNFDPLLQINSSTSSASSSSSSSSSFSTSTSRASQSNADPPMPSSNSNDLSAKQSTNFIETSKLSSSDIPSQDWTTIQFEKLTASSSSQPLDQTDKEQISENESFDVELIKKDGSLGFTISKIEFEGFFVKQITKAPAIHCPLIQPGDKIVRVNDVSLDGLSHAGAIQYLRGLPEKVHLKLSRTIELDLPLSDLLVNPSANNEIEFSTSANTSLNDNTQSSSKDLFSCDEVDSLQMPAIDLNTLDIPEQPLIKKPLRHEVKIMLSERANNELQNRFKRKDRRRSKEDTKNSSQVEENANLTLNSSSSSKPMDTCVETLEESKEEFKAETEIKVECESAVINIDQTDCCSSSIVSDNKQTVAKQREEEENKQRQMHLHRVEVQQDVQQLLFRQSSVIDFKSNRSATLTLNGGSGSSGKSGLSNILRWRGTRLDELDVSDQSSSSSALKSNVHLQLNQIDAEDQDSGFGEIKSKSSTVTHRNLSNISSASSSLSSAACANTNTKSSGLINFADSDAEPRVLNNVTSVFNRTADGLRLDEIELSVHSEYEPPDGSIYRRITDAVFFYVMLDRGWHGRLGFSLTDDMPHSPLVVNTLRHSFTACVVKELFPNSVAANCGRIRVGDKLLEVNFEPMINKPAKEVISELRKMSGKLRILFLRKQNPTDL